MDYSNTNERVSQLSSDSIGNHIESLIQNELNANNYDTNINIALNHLTQLINLSTSDCLLSIDQHNDQDGLINQNKNMNQINLGERCFKKKKNRIIMIQKYLKQIIELV